MRAEEFISMISKSSEDERKFQELKNRLPVGVDGVGEIVFGLKTEKPLTIRHIAVTGNNKSNYIRRWLITLSCLYERTDACFIVLSPKIEYGELLRLKSMDITVPYIRTRSDLEEAVTALKELIRMREEGKMPKLIIVLDGLEDLEDCNKNGDFEEYRSIFDLFMRREDIDVITGIDMKKSIFSGYPGAFAGIGNCFISTREDGKADVTYVQDDCSLTLPILIEYPSTPSVMETVIFLNALSGGSEV